MRSLTPSSENRIFCCPALQRLSISRLALDPGKWVMDFALQDPKDANDRRYEGQSSHLGMFKRPVIGIDLFRLVRNRSEFSSGHLERDQLENEAKVKCSRLETVKIIDCLVEPSTWICLHQTAPCDEMSSVPDPLRAEQQADIDEARKARFDASESSRIAQLAQVLWEGLA